MYVTDFRIFHFSYFFEEIGKLKTYMFIYKSMIELQHWRNRTHLSAMEKNIKDSETDGEDSDIDIIDECADPLFNLNPNPNHAVEVMDVFDIE